MAVPRRPHCGLAQPTVALRKFWTCSKVRGFEFSMVLWRSMTEPRRSWWFMPYRHHSGAAVAPRLRCDGGIRGYAIYRWAVITVEFLINFRQCHCTCQFMISLCDSIVVNMDTPLLQCNNTGKYICHIYCILVSAVIQFWRDDVFSWTRYSSVERPRLTIEGAWVRTRFASISKLWQFCSLHYTSVLSTIPQFSLGALMTVWLKRSRVIVGMDRGWKVNCFEGSNELNSGLYNIPVNMGWKKMRDVLHISLAYTCHLPHQHLEEPEWCGCPLGQKC